MIQSMTGYGKANYNSNYYTFEVELKSVNSRFLDIFVRLPKILSDREIEYRNLVKRYIRRGKITLNINYLLSRNFELQFQMEFGKMLYPYSGI